MIQTPKIQIASYVNLVLRRKWLVIIPFVLVLMGALVFLKLSPKAYRATTLILLEPQSIPDSFVRSTVMESMEGRLRTITQQIQSRTNLEKIAKEFHLARKPSGGLVQDLLGKIQSRVPFLEGRDPQVLDKDNESAWMMPLVDELRKRIQVSMRSSPSTGGGGREQSLVFEISFEWNDQDVVAPVTNLVASRFIEENLSAREEMAISTTDFLDKETAAIRSELEVREKDLETFKKENMGMLPDQLESNINILNQLRDQLLNLNRGLDQEKQQAMLVKSQSEMARMERDALASSLRQERTRPSTGVRRGEAQPTTDELTSGTLEDLERELQRLSSLYTEKHPDILALKRRIEVLKREGPKAQSGSTGASPGGTQDRTSVQLVPIMANIEAYKKQIQEVEKQIQSYKERVERTPQVEMALNKISRDYQTVKTRYDGLLAKKLDAKMAEQMERRKKGEQFRVLDPAIRPPRPFKPDALRVMAIALVLGLGLGGGLAYLREMLDPRFYNPEEVEDFLAVAVIATLPVAEPAIPR